MGVSILLQLKIEIETNGNLSKNEGFTLGQK